MNQRHGSRLLSACLVLVALSIVGWGTIGVGTAAAQTRAASEPLVTIDAENTSAAAVLELIAAKYGLDLVTSPEVRDARVTVHLNKVPLSDAVAMVVRAGGLAYQQTGTSVVVASATKMGDQGLNIPTMITLRHANPTRVAAALEGFGAVIKVDQSTGALIVSGPPVLRSQLTRIVEQLDVPARQVELRSRLIEVSHTAMHSLGIDWARLMSFTTIISEGRPSTSGSTAGGGETEPSSPPDQFAAQFKYYTFGTWPHLTHQQEAWRVTLDLLLQNGAAKVLSDAKLAALSSETARIHVGDVIPYVVSSPTTGGLVTFSVERERTGVEVLVTPRITADNEILADIEPSVSSVVAFRGPDASLPQTKERAARTSVRVRDGETIVIAGLQSEETKTTIDKVPLLGDIPILGKLFQHYKKESTKTDLVIEITPRLL